jgi:hypothetical protein
LITISIARILTSVKKIRTFQNVLKACPLIMFLPILRILLYKPMILLAKFLPLGEKKLLNGDSQEHALGGEPGCGDPGRCAHIGGAQLQLASHGLRGQGG